MSRAKSLAALGDNAANLENAIANVADDSTPQLGANLDVNSHSIVSTSNGNISITPNGSGKVILDGLNWPTADGSSNQVLKTDGSGNLSFVNQSSGGGDVVTDTSPQLGGNLDVNGNSIVSTSNADINITPNGTGTVNIATGMYPNFLGNFSISNAATFSFSNLFTSTYDIYDIIFERIKPVTNDVYLKLRLVDTNGTTITHSGGYGFYMSHVGTKSSDSTQSDSVYDGSHDFVYLSGKDEFAIGNTDLKSYHGRIRVFGAQQTGKHVFFELYNHYKSVDSYLVSSAYLQVLGSHYANTLMGGISIEFSSGNISSGGVAVYGLKSGV